MRYTSFLPLLALAGLGCADPTTPAEPPPPGTYRLWVEGPFMTGPFLLAGDSALVAVRIVEARTEKPVQTSPVWTVSAPGQATLHPFTGTVTHEQGEPTSPHQAWVKGLAGGFVAVVARLGADSAMLGIQVEEVTRIQIHQSEGPSLTGTVQPGDTLAFIASSMTSPGGHQLSAKALWSVDQPGIAAIREFTSRMGETNCCGPEPYGPGLLVIPLAPGTARITATVGTVSASVDVRVSP